MSGSLSRTVDSRQRLGRGLATLLGEPTLESDKANGFSGVKQIPIEFVRSSGKNPRHIFVELDLDELAASIRERGIIQPIVVRPVSGATDAYEIVAGERRWRAAQKAGLHSVPVISLEITDREALELSIVENVQRSDLTAVEEARGYAQLASEYGYSHTEIGRVIGKSRSHVANTLRLLSLPEHTRELLSSGAISAGHARALLAVTNPDTIADKVVAHGLSVREVEKMSETEKLSNLEPKPSSEVDAVTKDLQNRISVILGAKIEILNGKRIREIRIRFRDLEQLEYICGKLMA